MTEPAPPRSRPRRGARGLRAVAVLCGALAVPASAASADWSNFSPPGGTFRVELPGAPERATRARLTPLGKVHETRYTLHADGADLSVETHDVPAVAVAVIPDGVILDRALEGVIDNQGATRIHARELTVQGAPAREFSYRLPARAGEPERVERALSVLVGTRLYLLTGTTVDPAPHPAVSRFFASFRFWREGEERP